MTTCNLWQDVPQKQLKLWSDLKQNLCCLFLLLLNLIYAGWHTCQLARENNKTALSHTQTLKTVTEINVQSSLDILCALHIHDVHKWNMSVKRPELDWKANWRSDCSKLGFYMSFRCSALRHIAVEDYKCSAQNVLLQMDCLLGISLKDQLISSWHWRYETSR